MEPLPADHSYNPKALGSWARRTGYKSHRSGGGGGDSMSEIEIGITAGADQGGNRSSSVVVGGGPAAPQHPKAAAPSSSLEVLTNSAPWNHGLKSKAVAGPAPAPTPGPNLLGRTTLVVPGKKAGSESENVSGAQSNCPPNSGPLRIEPLRMYKDSEAADVMSQSHEDAADDYSLAKHSHMKYEIRETPGLFPLILYGIQHYFSMIGSLVLIPLVIVPAMDGNSKDTAKVISSMLLVSGISTLLHCFFGSRLPLIQGASFVYLAPVLYIIFSPKFVNLNKDRFMLTMRELQGAIIVSSLFQALLGYSGLMSVLLRSINPVVVAPTVAAVGLAFFAYGFPMVGTCVEIGIPQVLVIVFFALYLRKISVFGHRIFQIYAVPLGLLLVWAYAFLLTETKVYTYKGCDFNLLRNATTIVTPACAKHTAAMKSCRTDYSDVLSSAAWIWFPYPFQWGHPTFHWETAIVMIVASLIASVDSVGTYHATSLLVASRAPPPGVVSRGIGLEGLTSFLAGLWGTGAGASTLTENVHTIAVTKMGSRRAVEFGACVLILVAVVGKIGGFLASIPQVIAAGLLVFMWTMLAALGLSNLRYSETGSSRNVLIVGFSLFLSLSVPAYFQQYKGGSNAGVAGVPSYFQQYTISANGPIHTKYQTLNFALNTILSLNMVIAFLVAYILDNTVPGSQLERGTYVWSQRRSARNEPVIVKEYGLPFGLSNYVTWARWVGL
ncbi:unnamed protein product [Sphagnum jensenii]|uniref:Nucleobase-ascorbate transporter 12 n=1 Tax=Sphagnum jensenii TaxID=128206 RepID=A0ABP0W7K7_9BRYO